MKKLLSLLGLKYESSSQYAKEIILEKDYKFMYENFLVSSQRKLYLLLEKNEQSIEAITFNFHVYKYGYPNDEVDLPSKISGVVNYGLSEVYNSNWINELKINNRSHHHHSDKMFSNRNHYIVRFKDVTLEIITGSKFSIVQIPINEFQQIINDELENISNVG